MVEWKKLGEVMKIVRGASPRPITSYITSDSNGVNWIKIGDVEPGAKYITRCNEKVTKEGAQKSRYLHSGDFILSNSMSFGRPYILKIDGCIHDGWIAMSDFEKHLSSGYLYEVLNSNSVQSYWRMKANNGGAMTNLNSDIVKDTIIPIPPLSEQQRIVGILDTFTSAIDNLKEQIAQRRKQYEYYRDQLLDLEGKEGVEMKTLGDIMQIVRGASPRPIKNFITTKEDGINWIKIGDVAPGAKYVTSCNEKITKAGAEKSRFLHAGDFILSNSMSFGRPYILKIDGCIHDGWIAMSDFEKDVLPDYLYEYLNSDVVQKYWIMKANNGGAMTNLNSDIVKATPIYIPSRQEQRRIVTILDTFETSIQNLEAQLKEREKQYEYYRNKLLTFE